MSLGSQKWCLVAILAFLYKKMIENTPNEFDLLGPWSGNLSTAVQNFIILSDGLTKDATKVNPEEKNIIFSFHTLMALHKRYGMNGIVIERHFIRNSLNGMDLNDIS